MSAKKFSSIIRKVLGSFLFQVFSVTLILLLIVFSIIESDGNDISFVYNNF